MLDTFKHKGLREKMVEKLAEKGISDQKVLEAMRNVPRHLFIDSALADQAYEDKALPINQGQTISQPFTVAYQTQMLKLKSGMKVLEVGTGSGYQAAVLASMGMRVVSVEIISSLHRRAKTILEDLQFSVTLKLGDGSVGWSPSQPYQRIIVTAACPAIPPQLKQQMEVKGKMILPVGTLNSQQMYLVNRKSREEFQQEILHSFKFVPLRGRNGFRESVE
ncbi:MAG: protein-L-isoaspartate(D-aspartate) O-methyltransferase [Bacteroidota bacterium]